MIPSYVAAARSLLRNDRALSQSTHVGYGVGSANFNGYSWSILVLRALSQSAHVGYRGKSAASVYGYSYSVLVLSFGENSVFYLMVCPVSVVTLVILGYRHTMIWFRE